MAAMVTAAPNVKDASDMRLQDYMPVWDPTTQARGEHGTQQTPEDIMSALTSMAKKKYKEGDEIRADRKRTVHP